MQMDTQKTVAAMEETISHVVKGTAAAEDAGRALGDVEVESSRIAKLMINIAKVTKEQLDLSKKTQKQMISIQDITLESFERVSETTELINNLTKTAGELQVSVYRFNLPGKEPQHNKEPRQGNMSENLVQKNAREKKKVVSA